MKYNPTHPRVVRGKRVHETSEERQNKISETIIPIKISISDVETEFLTPTIEAFVETEQVNRRVFEHNTVSFKFIGKRSF